jgi:hypothetical protein
MRKMAVYLGLVEDDHRYQDKYDSYGEYEDYDDQADRPEQIDEPDVRNGHETTPATSPPTGAPSTCRRRPISPVLRHCILALTMKRVLLGNTSAKALR